MTRSSQSSRFSSEAVIVSIENPLAIHELAQACGADVAWVIALVEVGILTPPPAVATPHGWHFHGEDLRVALDTRRLERDLGVGLEAAALILDLQREVRRLKSVLHARG